MLLKAVIRYVLYVKIILGLGMFFFLFAFISNVEHPKNLIYVALFALPFVACYLLRGPIIKSYCNNGKYPAALLSVLTTLHQTVYLEFSENQQMVSSAKGNADYSNFLEDNFLPTTISANNATVRLTSLILLLVIIALFFLFKFFLESQKDMELMFIWIGLFAFLLISFLYFPWIKNKPPVEVLNPLITFTPEKLIVESAEMFWQKIIGWEYIKTGEDDPDQMIVWYHDDNYERNKYTIELKYDVELVDLCLLFHYFKRQYG